MFIQCKNAQITLNSSHDIYQRNMLCLFQTVVKLGINIGDFWDLMSGLLGMYTATQNIPNDGCSIFHQKGHTRTKLYGVTPMEANRFVHWCENLKFWLWNCSCRITQMMKYGLLLIQETWQQKMQITDWARPAVWVKHYVNNIAWAIFRHKSETLLQKQRYKTSNCQITRH